MPSLNNKKILIFSSIATSGVNFIIFVLLPLYLGSDKLSEFTRDNYVGGIYLFGVAGSVSVIATSIITKYNKIALEYYIKFSLISLSVIIISLYALIDSIDILVCIIAAIILHINGFLLTYLIISNKVIQVVTIQIIQPLVFLFLIILDYAYFNFDLDWFVYYIISTLISFFCFFEAVDFKKLALTLKDNKEEFNYQYILWPMLAGVSFPLIFQFENILVGEFTSIELGSFIILQKLYSSVAISLFGTYTVSIFGKDFDCKKQISNNTLFVSSLISVVVVFALTVFIENFLSRGIYIVQDYCLTILLTYLFSIAMFINFYMNICQVKYNIISIIVSFIAYMLIFLSFKPTSITEVLLVSSAFYCMYIVTYFTTRRNYT